MEIFGRKDSGYRPSLVKTGTITKALKSNLREKAVSVMNKNVRKEHPKAL